MPYFWYKPFLIKPCLRRNLGGPAWASVVNGTAAWSWLSQWCRFGALFCWLHHLQWGWPEREDLGSIHRKQVFPDQLIPFSLSGIFLSTAKTFCLVFSCLRPLETVSGFFVCVFFVLFFFHFSTCAFFFLSFLNFLNFTPPKCVRSEVHNA